MISFFHSFFRTLGFFFGILIIILTIIGFSIFAFNGSGDNFVLIDGEKKSENTIFILEISGPIIEDNSSINEFIGVNFISPSSVQKILNKVLELNPNIIIVSINSPGGTVSSSNKLYNIFLNFKKKTNSKIYFHTSELLASGGYWSSLAGDKIYASYGSILGSIGVKGPDWVYFNKPKLISSGFFGQTIEVQNEIEVYSTIAGNSKDLFNSFRKPTNKELNHLKKVVYNIYEDFLNLVSRSRKIETHMIEKDIGGLIFNSLQAKNNYLIDEELSLDELLKKIIRENDYKSYNIYKNQIEKNSLVDKLVYLNFLQKNKNNLNICNRLKTSITSLLSYSSVGC